MSFPVPNEYDMPDVKYNNGDAITLPPSLSGDGTGVNLSQLEKDLILTLFSKAAYAEDDAGTAYDTLENLWTAPQKEVESITAAYTQSGTVYDTDSLDSLKADLVVTANYAGGTSETVPASVYTLSGTLTAGTSTITVSYAGLSTTFSVTVTHAKQTVRHYFSDLDYVDGSLIKANKSVVTINNSGHVIIPYTKGMNVVTVMPVNWVANYPAIMKDTGAASYTNASAEQGTAVDSNIYYYSKIISDTSGVANVVVNFEKRFIDNCYYETEE